MSGREQDGSCGPDGVTTAVSRTRTRKQEDESSCAIAAAVASELLLLGIEEMGGNAKHVASMRRKHDSLF